MKLGIILVAESLAINTGVGLPSSGGTSAKSLERRVGITWWKLNFDDVTRHRPLGNHWLDTAAGYEIRFHEASGHRRDMSVSRVQYNQRVAGAFRRNGFRRARLTPLALSGDSEIAC